MGSCVSVHKDPDSVMKLRFSLGSKNDKILIPSPVKAKTVNDGDPTIADVPLNSHSAGSKDGAFFDSQPWLESDCEDDYYSVNGDFTPSRGNTPVHHSFTLGNLILSKEETIGSVAEPSSPPDKKKRLSELFKESLRGDADEDLARTPYFSRGSSERTPNGVLGAQDKSFKSPQCCLPKLLSNRSFSERKKKASPARSVG